MRSRRRCGGDRTPDVAETLPRPQQRDESLVQERPRAHVARLFLDPHDLRRVRIPLQRVGDHRLRERIELLDPDDRHVRLRLVAARFEVVVDLAGREDDALHVVTGDVAIGEHRLEAAARQLVDARHRGGMTQQRLRRHHDQRLARIVLHLPPQRVEVLRGRRRIDDLHVAFGAEREESLQPRARMLRPLAFVAVRQQHHQAAVLAPLLFGAGDELIDDDLRAVHEVAELRFPHHETCRDRRRSSRTRIRGRRTPTAASRIPRSSPRRSDRCLGKGVVEDNRIGDGRRRLLARQRVQRYVSLAGDVVEDDGVPLRERAAAAVLSGQTDAEPVQQQRAERGQLGGRPVERFLSGEHRGALRQHRFQFRMQREIRGQARHRLRDLLELFARDPGVGRRLSDIR